MLLFFVANVRNGCFNLFVCSFFKLILNSYTIDTAHILYSQDQMCHFSAAFNYLNNISYNLKMDKDISVNFT